MTSQTNSDGPCLNGATCKSGRNSFVCHCAPGFDGAVCQFKSVSGHLIGSDSKGTRPGCTATTCRDGATCVERQDDYDGDVIVFCLCPPGADETVADMCFSDSSQQSTSGLFVASTIRPSIAAVKTSPVHDQLAVTGVILASTPAADERTTSRLAEQSMVLVVSVVVAGVVTVVVAVTVTVAVVFCVRRRQRSRGYAERSESAEATRCNDVIKTNNNHIVSAMTSQLQKNVSVDKTGRNLLPVGVRLNNELHQ